MPFQTLTRSAHPRKPRQSRRRTVAIILFSTLTTTLLCLHATYTSPPSRASFNAAPRSPSVKALLAHLPPTSTSFAGLTALSPAHRADALAHALDAWRGGSLPTPVTVAAAVCTVRDAADALLRHDLSRALVIDVGAGTGTPVTLLALRRAVRSVISLDPDIRCFTPLSKILPVRGNDFVPLLVAASDHVGHKEMTFDDAHTNPSCFDCVPRHRHDHTQYRVTKAAVNVSTIDALVLYGQTQTYSTGTSQPVQGRTLLTSAGVRLLKSTTEGHETDVLRGARALLGMGFVRNVLVEFDTRLLKSKQNALDTLNQLFEAGFECTQLAFHQLSEEEKKGPVYPFFGRVAITMATADRFYDFVQRKQKSTDLLCSRR